MQIDIQVVLQMNMQVVLQVDMQVVQEIFFLVKNWSLVLDAAIDR
jgi:hypothetical protein